MTDYGGGAGSGRFGGSDDDSGTDRADRGTGRGGTSPDGPVGVDDPDPAPPEDDDDGGVNPGGRFGGGGGGGGGGRTGGTGRDPTRTITERTDISAGVGSPGGIDAPDISGTTAVEAVGRSNLGADPDTGDVDGTEAVVESFDPAAQVNRRIDTTEQPGLAARTIDVVTDGVRRANPTASAAVSGLATSFRTESGLPIPGTDRTLPGGRDFDRARGALEGAASGFDSAVSAGVEAATLDPDDAPLELSDVPLRDPAETAAIATLGTEAGRTGARAGIERGIQSFNPAAAGQDAATFAEFSVRGADRVQDAEAGEIQTGLDVGEAAGETAVEVGPEVAGAAVVDEPSRAFEAGATGATVAGLGALGPSAAGAGARAGRRVAGDVLDRAPRSRDELLSSQNVQRFLEDDRGQLDGLGRRTDSDTDTPEDSVTIGGEDVSGVRNPADPSRGGRFGARRTGGRSPDDPGRAVDPDPDAGTGTDTGSGLGFRSADTETRTADTFQSTPEEPDFSGLGTATRQADVDVTIPRDPLDTRGGLGFGGSTAAEGVATGAGVGGLLGQAAETAQSSDLDLGGGQADSSLGLDVWAGLGTDTGTATDTTPTGDTDTDLVTGTGTDRTPVEVLRINARTQLGSRGATRQDTPAIGTGQTISQPARGAGGRTGRPGPRISGRRVPDLPELDDESEDDGLGLETDADDEVFASGLISGEAAAEDIFGDGAFRL